MTHPSSALAGLFGSAGAKKFLKAAWPHEHFVTHRKVSELPQIFRSGPLSSFEEISSVYGGRLQAAGGRGDSHLQFSISQAPAEYLRRVGLTVFFGDDVSVYTHGGAEFLRTLEAELEAPVGLGAIRMFASAPNGGLEAHYDQGETILVQLEGQKEIRLAKNQSYPTLQFIPGKPPAEEHYPEFGHGFPDRAPPDEIVVRMKPGSVLFIPRGMWHRTEAGKFGASFSASICLDVPNAIDVLLAPLRSYLRSSPAWREPLFGAWGSAREDAARRVEALLADLREKLPTLSADELLDGASGLDTERRPLRDSSRLQRIPTTKLKLGTGSRADRLLIHVYGGRNVEILINSDLKPACIWLSKRRPAFTFGEFREQFPKVDPAVLERFTRSLLGSDTLKWLSHDNYQ